MSVKKFSIYLLALCFTLIQVLPINHVFAQSSQPDRLSGSDRYKTAAAISQKGWPNGADYAVIARGDDFADALCAGPLAKKYNAPILLTQTSVLNNSTLNELQRLNVKNVFIIGGTGAISQNIEDSLRAAGIAAVERIWGRDRYETSVRIAERIGTSTNIVLATGENFPDALSISPIAAQMGMPILLTMKDTLPQSLVQYITNSGVTRTYLIGGVGVISDSVMFAVPGYKRLGGRDRYETNVLVMQEFAGRLDFSNIYAAVGDGPNGNEFADALAGAVLAAKTSSPVILAYGTLPGVIADFLKTRVSQATSITALGGEAAMPPAIVNSMQTLINNQGTVPPAVTPPPEVTPEPEVTPTPPAGGGAVTPPAEEEEDADISNIKIITYDGDSLPGVGNGDTVNLSKMEDSVQIKYIQITASADCTIVLTGILDENRDSVNLPKEFRTTLRKDTSKKLDIDDILDGITKGDNGVGLGSLRSLCGDSATITGKLEVGGKAVNTVNIKLKLN